MSSEPREDIDNFTSLAPCIALRELEGPTFSPPQNRPYMGRARNFGLGWIKDILYTSNDTYSYEGMEMNLRDVGVGLIFFLGANLAQAVYTININQVGPDVVMSGSGSINTSSFSSVGLIGPCLLGDGFIGTNALCIGSDTNGDWYPGALSPGISLPSIVPTGKLCFSVSARQSNDFCRYDVGSDWPQRGDSNVVRAIWRRDHHQCGASATRRSS